MADFEPERSRTAVRPSLEYLPWTQLRLDPENPRFVSKRDTTDLGTFLPWFYADADLLPVISSIAANGYQAAEPLLVAPGKDDPTLVVVEGNRRFAAVLLLLNPKLLPKVGLLQQLSDEADHEQLAELPCLSYPERDDVLSYLGNKHVVGVKEWKPLAKAVYLRQLQNRARAYDEPDDDKSLAKRIGSTAPYVRRLLNSLTAFEAVDIGGPRDETRFSVMQTALQYSKIAAYVGIGARTPAGEDDIKPKPLQQLADWTLKGASDGKGAPRVNSRKLDLLSDVVASEEARRAFEAGETIERAHRLTGAVSAALQEALEEVAASLREAVNQAGRLLDPPTAGHRSALQEITDLVDELSSKLQ